MSFHLFRRQYRKARHYTLGYGFLKTTILLRGISTYQFGYPTAMATAPALQLRAVGLRRAVQFLLDT
uniref:Uncharacterized protein n=1 Tax=Candidatus Kentrum sp. DK TaxID=2126562 RepID=A0A450T5R2_9GAMM|nr:MAG: hypothetical protein BECKDK2373B_GA0170837_110716 [Candidatus Kentron sp. DK]VFJ64715.1 MAG: hypothetical protein BECKDK2373C_GA0170839_112015 [Candidatus Kentron sp. DK]